MGGDIIKVTSIFSPFLFQSTPPLWEATASPPVFQFNILISIHASTMGGDVVLWIYLFQVFLFQSTPPLWEATNILYLFPSGARISIHASTMGGDAGCLNTPFISPNFNPRLHYGRRLHRAGPGRQDNRDFNPRLHYGRRHNNHFH